jgi:hypothetical protein
VGHGPGRFLGVFAGDGQDLRDLLGGEFARATAPRQVAEQFGDRVRQGGRLLAAFDMDQAIEIIGPAVPPGSDGVAFTSNLLGDLLVGETFEGQEDHPSPLGEGLGTSAGTGHGLEGGLLPFGDDELACPPWHSCDSWCSACESGRLGGSSQSRCYRGRWI